MEIMINITSRCNMHCKNCALETMTTSEKRLLPQVMGLFTFVEIVDKLIDYGFDEFQLTPTVGEPFLHPDFLEMIAYLEHQPKVKRITFFTNLAVKDLGDKIGWLMQYTTKTVMFVSIYGTNRSDFDTFTNTTKCYKNFSHNMSILKSYYKSSFRSLNFFIRNPSYETSKNNLIKGYIEVLAKIKPKAKDFFDRNNIQKNYWNGNWCSYRDDVENKREDKKRGLCDFALIDNIVDADGTISLCGACDVMRTTPLGNIFVDELDDIYKEGKYMWDIVNEQGNDYYTDCCEKCSEFHGCDAGTLLDYMKLHNWTREGFDNG